MKTVLLALLCIPFMAQAQLSQNLSQHFAAHILYKIDEVASKVALTEAKQIKIGQKLFTADSLATIYLIKGTSVTQLKSFYTIDANFLKPILSPEELDAFQYENDKDNRFLVALKFATEFKLNPNQITEIRIQNSFLETHPKPTTKESIVFFNAKLGAILSREQYILVLQKIYKEQSIADAKKDWVKIEQLQLITDEKKKNSEYNKIENYHSMKNSFLDLHSEKLDKKELEKLTDKIALQEPPLLVRANILSAGIFKDNTFSSIIKYEKDIKLTEIQIDTILYKYKQLELIRFENHERELTTKLLLPEPSQYANIITILTPEQINLWLAKKCYDQAIKVALRNWKKLEEEELNKGLDRDSTILEFTNYQIKFMVADEKTRMYNTTEYAFYKRDIEQKKPELLKKLDAIARNKSKGFTTKNGLTW